MTIQKLEDMKDTKKISKVKRGMIISVRVAKKYNMTIRQTRKLVTKYCAY